MYSSAWSGNTFFRSDFIGSWVVIELIKKLPGVDFIKVHVWIFISSMKQKFIEVLKTASEVASDSSFVLHMHTPCNYFTACLSFRSAISALSHQLQRFIASYFRTTSAWPSANQANTVIYLFIGQHPGCLTVH